MSFQQYYYTSCEVGRSGTSGFQINAMTQGIEEASQRVLGQIGDYGPPYDSPKQPTAEQLLAAFPVSLSYLPAANGDFVFARSVYVGKEFVGGSRSRGGNFFCHGLVTRDLTGDLTGLSPVDLWHATFWAREPVSVIDLPPLDLPAGLPGLDRTTLLAFLGDGERLSMLPHLLSASLQGVGGTTDRRIVLIGQAAEVALWVSVLSWILPTALVSRLSFTTYTRSPERSPLLICGTVPDGDFRYTDPQENYDFFVFDLTTGRYTEETRLDPFAEEATQLLATGSAETLEHFSDVYDEITRIEPSLSRSLVEPFRISQVIHGHSVAQVTGILAALPNRGLGFVHRWPELLNSILRQPSLAREDLRRIQEELPDSVSSPAAERLRTTVDLIDAEYSPANLTLCLGLLESGELKPAPALESEIDRRIREWLLVEGELQEMLSYVERYVDHDRDGHLPALIGHVTELDGSDEAVADAVLRLVETLRQLPDGLAEESLRRLLGEIVPELEANGRVGIRGRLRELCLAAVTERHSWGRDLEFLRLVFSCLPSADRTASLLALAEAGLSPDESVQVVFGPDALPLDAVGGVLNLPVSGEEWSRSRVPSWVASKIWSEPSLPFATGEIVGRLAQLVDPGAVEDPRLGLLLRMHGLEVDPDEAAALQRALADVGVPASPEARTWLAEVLLESLLADADSDKWRDKAWTSLFLDGFQHCGSRWQSTMVEEIVDQLPSAEDKRSARLGYIIELIVWHASENSSGERGSFLQDDLPEILARLSPEKLSEMGGDFQRYPKLEGLWAGIVESAQQHGRRSLLSKLRSRFQSLLKPRSTG
ncbi:hypothetical protein ACFL5T_01770 [Gemmatimonadota bacterium]